jgi:ubiquinone/menaquinone biosynthesis C-methylase UbiE
MKNPDSWQPTKYVYRKGKLAASKDTKEVGIASRLAAGLSAGFYDEALKQHAKGVLLDLGCGKAPLYIAYKDIVDKSVCCDWANSVHDNPHLDFVVDLTKVLPFEDDSFDTIILSDVLEHLPEPELLWAEVHRVLRKDGKILMSVPFFYCLHEQPYDFYRYTEFALRRFVDKANLQLVELNATGGSPEVLADIFAKHLQFVPLIGGILAKSIQYLTAALVRTGFGKKLSRKTAETFPYGYTLVAVKGA